MQKFILALALSFCVYGFGAGSANRNLKVAPILSAATTTGAGTTSGLAAAGEKTFQAVVTGSGAVTATVLIQVSNNVATQGWATLGTITLSGTTTDTAGFASDAGWAYYRANVTALTGTSAAVTVTQAFE